MRVLVVSQYFWPENFRINDLVSELTARGHSVTVLTGVPNYPEGRTFPEFAKDPGRFSQYAGAPVIRVPMLPRRQGKLHLALNYLSFAWSGAGGCADAGSMQSSYFRSRPSQPLFPRCCSAVSRKRHCFYGCSISGLRRWLQ